MANAEEQLSEQKMIEHQWRAVAFSVLVPHYGRATLFDKEQDSDGVTSTPPLLSEQTADTGYLSPDGQI